MPLEDTTQENVLFVGGKAAVVVCPECDFESWEVGLESHIFSAVTCPECDAMILTKEGKSALGGPQALLPSPNAE